ncbi:MAG: hypothetical protein EHM43_09430 [Ignavibacteriae bacterium]|nr:MAG: hypothetical protein EHM43_09430 [Ignavibacteriota bacterium]
MSIRTIDELKAALIAAGNIDDMAAVAALEQCARECEALGTAESRALAERARASAEYRRGDHRASIAHYQRALELYNEIGDHQSSADVTNKLCVVELYAGNYPAALEYGQRALALHEELGDKSGIASDYRELGTICYSTGDLTGALEYYHRALAICEDLGDARGASGMIINIGNVYDGIGHYPQALEHFHRALAIKQELGDQRSVARIIGNIGVVYRNTGNYEMSLEYVLRALNMREELGDRYGTAYSTSSVGTLFAAMGKWSEALEYHHRALALHEELGERESVARVTVNIITALIYSGKLDEAEDVLAVLETKHIDHPTTVINRMNARALIQKHNGQLDEAMETFRRALEHAQEYAILPAQTTVHQHMRDLCQERNNFAGYIEHNNEFNRITEEINGKDTTTRLALLEAEQKMAKERSEHEKHLAVLHSTLPKSIADRVARGETVNDHYDNAAVIFLDIVGFTTISEQLSSDQVVQLLEQIFTTLDAVCEKHDVVKIKTIGDSYMAVAFPSTLPHFIRDDNSLSSRVNEESVIPNEVRNEVCRAANAALDMLNAIADLPNGPLADLLENLREALPSGLQVRIGLHSGPVTAGVIGTSRMQYDVWGDTVNVASRMESTSEPGRIHVSSSFALALNSEKAKGRNSETAVIPSVSEEQGTSSQLPVPSSLRERGALEIKGKGTMITYWLDRPLT